MSRSIALAIAGVLVGIAPVIAMGSGASDPPSAPITSRVPTLDPTVSGWEFPLTVDLVDWRVRLQTVTGAGDETRQEVATRPLVANGTLTPRAPGKLVTDEPKVIAIIGGMGAARAPTLLIEFSDSLVLIASGTTQTVSLSTEPRREMAPSVGATRAVGVHIDSSAIAPWPPEFGALALAMADVAGRRAAAAMFVAVEDPDAPQEASPRSSDSAPRPHITLRLTNADPAALNTTRAAPATLERGATLTVDGAICDPHGLGAHLTLDPAMEPLPALIAVASALLRLAGAPEPPVGLSLEPEAAASLREAIAGMPCLARAQPGVPDVVAAEPLDCGRVRLSWSAVAHADQYEVLVGEEEEVTSMRPLALLNATALEHEIDRGPDDGRRWFAVRGVAGDFRGPPSRTVAAPLAKPPESPAVTASSGECNAIELWWTPVADAVTYEVNRALRRDAPMRRVAESTLPSFRDDAVRPGEELWYTVYAIDACGHRSAPSAPAAGAAVSAPMEVRELVATVDCDGVWLNWPPVGAATQYILLRGVGDGALEPISLVEALPARSGTFDPDPPRVQHLRYAVRAAGPCGLGPPSPVATAEFIGRQPLLEPPPSLSVECDRVVRIPGPQVRNKECAGEVAWMVPDAVPDAVLQDDGSIELMMSASGAQSVTLRVIGAGGETHAKIPIDVTAAPPAVELPPSLVAQCGLPWTSPLPTVMNARCAGEVLWTVLDGPAGLTLFASPPTAPRSHDEPPAPRPTGVRWPAPTPGAHTVRLACTGPGGIVEITTLIEVAHEAPALEPSLELIVRAGETLDALLPTPRNDACVGTVAWSLSDAPEGVSIANDHTGWRLRWTDPPPGRHLLECIAAGTGGVAHCMVTLRVAPPAPDIVAFAPRAAPCATLWTSPPPDVRNASEAGPVRWRLVEAPRGALMDADGAVTWPQPTVGEHRFRLMAEGPAGSTPVEYMLTIAPAAPTLTLPHVLTVEADATSVHLELSIGNAECAGDVEWRLVSGPAGAALTPLDAEPDVALAPSRARLLWSSPTNGAHPFVVVAAGDAGETQSTITIDVLPAAPRLAAMPIFSIHCGSPWTVSLPTVLNSGRAGEVSWTIESGPYGLLLRDDMIRWEQPAAGRHEFTLLATGTAGITAAEGVIIVPAGAPTLRPIEPQTVACGTDYPPTPLAVDSRRCAGELVWRLLAGPAGLAVDSAGTVTWPQPVPGHYPVVVEVASSAGADRVGWTITVAATAAPEITPRPGDEVVLVAHDSDPPPYHGPPLHVTRPACMAPVTWQLASAPAGMTIDATGLVRWDQPQLGTHEIVVEATNPSGTGRASWSLIIKRPDEEPAGGPDTVIVMRRGRDETRPNWELVQSLHSADADATERTRRDDAGRFARSDGIRAPVRSLPALPQVPQPEVHARARRCARRDHRARWRLRGRGTADGDAQSRAPRLKGDDLQDHQAAPGGGDHHAGALRSAAGALPAHLRQGPPRLHRLHADRAPCRVPERRADAIA